MSLKDNRKFDNSPRLQQTFSSPLATIDGNLLTQICYLVKLNLLECLLLATSIATPFCQANSSLLLSISHAKRIMIDIKAYLCIGIRYYSFILFIYLGGSFKKSSDILKLIDFFNRGGWRLGLTQSHQREDISHSLC